MFCFLLAKLCQTTQRILMLFSPTESVIKQESFNVQFVYIIVKRIREVQRSPYGGWILY